MLTNREIIASLVVRNKGNWNDIYQGLMNKQYGCGEEKVEGDYITILDEEYPDILKKVYKPPFILFYKGNISLLKNNRIIGVGMDNTWDYDWEILDKVVFDNENIFATISNSCSKGVARSTKRLILVANRGIDKLDTELVNLVVNNGGLVISEMPYGVETDNWDCSRIVSGIESKLVIVHCDNRSYAIRQVMSALSLGHDIYAMPTPLDSLKETKNNELISQGATLLYNHEQLLAWQE